MGSEVGLHAKALHSAPVLRLASALSCRSPEPRLSAEAIHLRRKGLEDHIVQLIVLLAGMALLLLLRALFN